MTLHEKRPRVIIDFNDARLRRGVLRASDIPAEPFAEQEAIKGILKTAAVGAFIGVAVPGIVLIASLNPWGH